MASAMLLALALVTPQPDPVALDGLIAFADPGHCTPSPGFAQLLAEIRADRDGDRSKLTAVQPRYRPGFGKLERTLAAEDGFEHAYLATWGTWHGLRLNSIEIWSRSDIKPAFALVFNAPEKDVVETLTQLGFGAATIEVKPESGDIAVTEPVLVRGHDVSQHPVLALRCPLP